MCAVSRAQTSRGASVPGLPPSRMLPVFSSRIRHVSELWRRQQTLMSARPLPAKGERIAVRYTPGSGQPSRHWGMPWTPGTVEQLTEHALVIVEPISGGRLAFALADAWEWCAAVDAHFWRTCRPCEGFGETYAGAGEPCPGCEGRGTVKRMKCPTCNGTMITPGTLTLLSCLECDGWGERMYDPFNLSRRERWRRDRARTPKAGDDGDTGTEVNASDQSRPPGGYVPPF